MVFLSPDVCLDGGTKAEGITSLTNENAKRLNGDSRQLARVTSLRSNPYLSEKRFMIVEVPGQESLPRLLRS